MRNFHTGCPDIKIKLNAEFKSVQWLPNRKLDFSPVLSQEISPAETVLSCGAVCFVIQCGSYFLLCGSNHAVWPFFGMLQNSPFMWCCLFCDTVWFLLFTLWIKPCSVTILWKATEQYVHVVLFVLWYSVVLTFYTVYQTRQNPPWSKLHERSLSPAICLCYFQLKAKREQSEKRQPIFLTSFTPSDMKSVTPPSLPQVLHLWHVYRYLTRQHLTLVPLPLNAASTSVSDTAPCGKQFCINNAHFSSIHSIRIIWHINIHRVIPFTGG